jgi:hypothetical protein
MQKLAQLGRKPAVALTGPAGPLRSPPLALDRRSIAVLIFDILGGLERSV